MSIFNLFRKKRRRSFDDLYLKILRYGRSQVDEYGITYNELKSYLQKEGYDLSDECWEFAPKQWFYESHIHLNDDDKPNNNLKEFTEHHLGCPMMLRGDHALKLVQYETSRNALRLSSIAIIIAFLAFLGNGLVVWLPKIFPTTEIQSTTNLLEHDNHGQINHQTQIPIADTVGYVISISPLH